MVLLFVETCCVFTCVHIRAAYSTRPAQRTSWRHPRTLYTVTSRLTSEPQQRVNSRKLAQRGVDPGPLQQHSTSNSTSGCVPTHRPRPRAFAEARLTEVQSDKIYSTSRSCWAREGYVRRTKDEQMKQELGMLGEGNSTTVSLQPRLMDLNAYFVMQ